MTEPLTGTEFLQGMFSTLYVSISIIIGLIIISKYFKYKKSSFLLIGVAWTGMAIPWLGDVINFFAYFANIPYLTDEVYLIIVNAFLPLFVILWLTALSDLLNYQRKKVILIISLISSIVFEIIFFSFILTGNTAALGYSITPFQYHYEDFISFYMLIMIVIVLATGLKFAIESLTKAKERDIKLKGKLLIIAFILFTSGAILDAAGSAMLGEISPAIIVLVRLILISSSIIFYLGFILPEWLKKILFKEKSINYK